MLLQTPKSAAPFEPPPHAHGAAIEHAFEHISAADYALVNGPAAVAGEGGLYPASFTTELHSHERDQVLYSGSGILTVSSDQGSFLLPPERALWVPAGVRHSVTMIGPVLTRSVFIEPRFNVRSNRDCAVIVVSSLLHALLMAAHEMKDQASDLRKNMLMAMLMMEIRLADVEPLALAIPTTKLLAAKCSDYLVNPTPHEKIDDWCDDLGMSRRAFTRLFRRETGESFASWRQKACILTVLPRLTAGETVTAIAYSIGYSSTAAFTSMFRRIIGLTPRNYLERAGLAAPSLDFPEDRLAVA